MPTKKQKIIVKINEEEIQLTNSQLDFYKNETGKQKIDVKSIERFYQNLYNIYSH